MGQSMSRLVLPLGDGSAPDHLGYPLAGVGVVGLLWVCWLEVGHLPLLTLLLQLLLYRVGVGWLHLPGGVAIGPGVVRGEVGVDVGRN